MRNLNEIKICVRGTPLSAKTGSVDSNGLADRKWDWKGVVLMVFNCFYRTATVTPGADALPAETITTDACPDARFCGTVTFN